MPSSPRQPSLHLRRPAFAAFVSSLALIGAFVACGKSAPTEQTAAATPVAEVASAVNTPVRIQLNWFPEPEFGGFYAARERGLFTTNGVEVELLSGGADVPAPQMVASGKVEMGVLAAEQVLTLRAAGGAVKAVFASFQRAPRVIIVKATSPHTTLEALWRSKATILAQDGMAFIRFLNRQYGGSELSFVPYAGSAAPLLADTVDAMQGFATAEPVQLELDGHATRSFLVGDAGYDPYDVVLVANEEFLAREPAKVAAVIAALTAGWQSYLADPLPINTVMASLNRDMSEAVMAKSAALLPSFLESDDTRANGLGHMDPARWAQLGAQLVELGDLTAPVDTTAAFVNLGGATPPATPAQ